MGEMPGCGVWVPCLPAQREGMENVEWIQQYVSMIPVEKRLFYWASPFWEMAVTGYFIKIISYYNSP